MATLLTVSKRSNSTCLLQPFNIIPSQLVVQIRRSQRQKQFSKLSEIRCTVHTPPISCSMLQAPNTGPAEYHRPFDDLIDLFLFIMGLFPSLFFAKIRVRKVKYEATWVI